jgi:hypothetical protein
VADLTVIVPSRGRPEQCRALVQAFRDTCTADTRLVLSVDDDDPRCQDYIDIAFGGPGFPVGVFTGSNRSMVEALNRAASEVDGIAVGFLGDDHCPRTVGWDAAYLETLRELGTGIVYGNDLLQGERLPTQVAMTTDIVRALGWMAPPSLIHLAVDNAWLELGRAADFIRYLPDVIVEHRHPVAGKAQWDDGYKRVNAPEMYHRDLSEFDRWHREDMPSLVEKIRALRGAA